MHLVSQGLNPIHVAAKYRKLEVLEYLLEHCHIDVDSVAMGSGDTPLHCVLSQADASHAAQCVRLLLKKRADCNRCACDQSC